MRTLRIRMTTILNGKRESTIVSKGPESKVLTLYNGICRRIIDRALQGDDALAIVQLETEAGEVVGRPFDVPIHD